MSVSSERVLNPRLLILETSGRKGGIGLAEGSTLRSQIALDETRRHARDLAPAVKELLQQCGWRPRDLHGVIVNRGPGSYTGLRVGIMAAKAFAYASDCALLGVDSFHAIALQSPAECERIAVLGDAQKEDVYFQPFIRAEHTWKATDNLRIIPFEEWLHFDHANAWVSGPGVSKWDSRIPSGIQRVATSQREPSIESLLQIGLARYRTDERDDLYAMEPLYLRASAAERQWADRRG